MTTQTEITSPRPMPAARHLKAIVLTGLVLVVTASIVGGVLVARSEAEDRTFAFVGGFILFFGNTAPGGVLIAATHHLAIRLVSRLGPPGALLRLGVAMGSAVLVSALWFAVDLLVSGDPDPKKLFLVDYKGWVLASIALSPVLAFTHAKVIR